jgi:predicted regulator of Ras-like GTPase activity (Roadblock/LC7/MglB family)
MNVSAFSDALARVARRVPEIEVVMIIGTDGIPIEKLLIRPDPNMEAVAAELTTLLRASLSAAADTGLGELLELSMVTERMTTLLVAITPDYFLFAALQPGAILGRARFSLRMAGESLLREFD